MPHLTASFFDIDDTTASSLESALQPLGFRGQNKPAKADLVFCSRGGLSALPRKPKGPVVVIGRDDSSRAWIAALDAGADDYLCEGFEPIQIRWLVQSLLGAGKLAAAA